MPASPPSRELLLLLLRRQSPARRPPQERWGRPCLRPNASAFPRVPSLDPVFGSGSSQTLPEAPGTTLTKLPHCWAMDLCCNLPLCQHSHFRSTLTQLSELRSEQGFTHLRPC